MVLNRIPAAHALAVAALLILILAQGVQAGMICRLFERTSMLHGGGADGFSSGMEDVKLKGGEK